MRLRWNPFRRQDPPPEGEGGGKVGGVQGKSDVPVEAMRGLGSSIFRALNPGASRRRAKAAGDEMALKMMQGMRDVLLRQQNEQLLKAAEEAKAAGTPLPPEQRARLQTLRGESLDAAVTALGEANGTRGAEAMSDYQRAVAILDHSPELDEQVKLQKVVGLSLDAYHAAREPLDLGAGFNALHAFRAAKTLQRAHIDEEDLGRMRSDLFGKAVEKAAREALARTDAERMGSGPDSAEERISSLLRQRARAGVTLSAGTLRLAAEAWAKFSAADEARIAGLRKGTLPATKEEAESSGFAYVREVGAVAAEQSLKSFGYTASTLPEEARKALSSNVDLSLDVGMSRLRTVLYDRNPFSAPDGLARLERMEGLAAMARTWGLELKYVGPDELSKLGEYRAQLEAMAREAQALGG